MTLQDLQAKLADIQNRKDVAMANYNAICGAEQMILELIEDEVKKTIQPQTEEDLY